MNYFDKINDLETILINKIGLGIVIYIIDLLSFKNLRKILNKLSTNKLNDNIDYLKKKIQIRLNNGEYKY
jgi:hypothetical protein